MTAFGELEAIDYKDKALIELVSLSRRTGYSLEWLKTLSAFELRKIQAILNGLDKASHFIRSNPKAFGG